MYGQFDASMQEPTVADMSIADEHIVVETKTRISDVCKELAVNPDHAVLVKKGSEVLGVVTARVIFQTMSEGVNATKIKVNKIMKTNILTMAGDTPLSSALEMMSKANPDAIIITDSDNQFIGYFSTKDYRDATRKLEAHQLMSARLRRSRKAISEKVSSSEKEESGVDLLDLLLGDIDDEDDEEVEVPSMFNLE
ncbi:MAG: CBS domain-containing protein [Candidatus Poseidoniales archaeon]|nr:MAG: CBS domain-containing protein [Candidatus Poseidoniales archaeon]